MSNPIVTIHNVETGKIVSREMNEKELLVYEATQISIKAQEVEKAKAEAEKTAILAKIGLTADEAKLLLS